MAGYSERGSWQKNEVGQKAFQSAGNSHASLLTWLALYGIVMPALNGVVDGVLVTLERDYSPVRQFMSDLASAGRPHARLLSVWWMAFPLEFVPFAMAVYLGTGRNRYSRITLTLLMIFSVGICFCGVFPCAPGCHGRDPCNVAHCIASSIAMLALFPCPFFLWLSIRRDRCWRRLGSFSLSIQVLAIAGMLVLVRGLLGPEQFLFCGLAERTFLAVYYLWTVGVALKLLRLGPRNYCGAT